MSKTPEELTPEILAKKFHDFYEAEAYGHGWETNSHTRVEFKDLPKENKSLMIATCEFILDTVFEQYRQDGINEVLEEIPTSWLDTLLTGKDKVIGEPPYNGIDIENLLNAIRNRIKSKINKSILCKDATEDKID